MRCSKGISEPSNFGHTGFELLRFPRHLLVLFYESIAKIPSYGYSQSFVSSSGQFQTAAFSFAVSHQVVSMRIDPFPGGGPSHLSLSYSVICKRNKNKTCFHHSLFCCLSTKYCIDKGKWSSQYVEGNRRSPDSSQYLECRRGRWLGNWSRLYQRCQRAGAALGLEDDRWQRPNCRRHRVSHRSISLENADQVQCPMWSNSF